MTPEDDSTVRRRRRGTALEADLLDAAWDELVATGFPTLTMEAVAVRARTGVAVLYRRWPNKDGLALAALRHRRDTYPVDLPDTGTLRGDLLAALSGMGVAQAGFFVVAAQAALSGLLAGSGLTPAQVRERVIGEERLARVQALYRRAHDRGEIDLARVPSGLLAMPFDLVRHDLLMQLQPVPLERIEAILDGLFLPMVRLSAGPSPKPAA